MAIKFLNSVNADSGVLYVDATNNRVGIGTTSPVKTLNVAGSVRFSESGYDLDITNGANVVGSNHVVLKGNSSYVRIQSDNNSIYLRAAQDVIVKNTSDVEQMRFTSNGRIGIGTTSPSTTLQVVGDDQEGVRVTGGTNGRFTQLGSSELSFYTTSTSGWAMGNIVRKNSDDSLLGYISGGYGGVNSLTYTFYGGTAYNNAAMYILSSNKNVGIGTTSPGSTLTVHRDLGSGGTLAEFKNSNATYSQQMYLSFDSNKTVTWSQGSSSGGTVFNSGTQGIRYEINSSEKMRITSAGNVGIGTTSPYTKLDVRTSTVTGVTLPTFGQSAHSGIHIVPEGNATTEAWYGITFGNTASGSSERERTTAGIFTSAQGSYGNKLYFATSNSWATGAVSRMMIDHNGNVGIGTTSPAVDLHVADDVRIDDDLFVRTISSQYFSSSNNLSLIYGDAANFTVSSNATERFRITSSGNVGIGTTSPSEKLHVNGNITADEYKYNGAERVESKNWKFTASVNAGYYEELGQWRATEGNVVLRVTVASNTSANSGTAVYILQGGFNQAADGWFEILPAFKGGGHGNAQDGWKVLWYDNASYSYKLAVAVPSGLANKNLHISVELLSNPDGDSYYQYQALSTTGTIPSYSLDRTTSYSHRDLISSDSVTAQYDANNYTVLGYDSLDTYGGSQVFKTAGTERMRIATNGYTGIGTTSPAQKLHVAGGDIQLDSGKYIRWAGALGIKKVSNNAMYFYAGTHSTTGGFNFATWNGSTYDEGTVVIRNSGNVGIGTTSPTKKLHIYTSANEGIYVQGTSGGAWMDVKSSGGNIFSFGADNGGGGIYDRTNAAYRLYVRNNGNVGIGAHSSASQKLHVVGNIRVTGAYYDSNNSAGTLGQVLSSTETGTDWVSLSEIQGVDGSGTANYIAKWSDTDTIANSVIYDDGTNVGIGTTSPQAGKRLDVRSDASIAGSNAIAGYGYNDSATAILANGYATSGTGTNYGIRGISTGTRSGGTNVGGHFSASGAGTNYALTTGSGNVGIGTTSPTAKLDIRGGSTTEPTLRLESSSGAAVYGLITGTDPYHGLIIRGVPSGATTYGVTYGDQMSFFEYGGQFRFYEKNNLSSGTLNEIARIDKSTSFFNSNVGIGTTSPSAKLHIVDGNNYVKIGDINGISTAVIELNDGNPVQVEGYNSDLTFRTNGSRRMTITNTGNVGIGTTSPSYKLDVAGDIIARDTYPSIYVDHSGTVMGGLRSDATTKLELKTLTTAPLSFQVNSSEKMRITNSGNVGIGTTSPNYNLTVYNDSLTDSFPIVAGSGVSAGEFVGIGLAGYVASNGAVKAGMVLDRVGNFGTGDIHFLNNSTEDNNDATLSDSKLVIKEDGKVGIGTTSPQANLEVRIPRVNDGTRQEIQRFTHLSENTLSVFAYGGSTNLIQIGAWNQEQNIAIVTESLANTTATTTKGIYIKSGGNVGIGTTSPTYKLQVEGGQSFFESARFGTTGGDRIVISNRAANDVAIESFSAELFLSSGYNGISFEGSANTTLMKLTDSGNVGIGTTSPAAKLQVDGHGSLDGEIRINASGDNSEFGILRFVGDSATYEKYLIAYNSAHPSQADEISLKNAGGDVTIYTGTSGASSEKVRIDTSGKVGIGITSPSAKLHVNGGDIYVMNNGGNPRFVIGDTTSNGDWGYMRWYSAGDRLEIGTSGTAHMHILESGNIGIGTHSPTETLEVDGNVKADSFIGGNEAGIYTFNDTVNASSSEDIFSVSCTNGAAAFRVTFVCSTSGMSVAKTYEVVKAYNADPVFFKVVDTGAYSGHDFDVSFADVSSTGVKATITNNSTTINANIVTTVFLGGSPTTITVTAL